MIYLMLNGVFFFTVEVFVCQKGGNGEGRRKEDEDEVGKRNKRRRSRQ
jgi:hypothetical protein